MASYFTYGDPYKLKKYAYEDEDGNLKEGKIKKVYGIQANVGRNYYKSQFLKYWPTTMIDGVEVLLPYYLYRRGTGKIDDRIDQNVLPVKYTIELDEPIVGTKEVEVALDYAPEITETHIVEVELTHKVVSNLYRITAADELQDIIDNWDWQDTRAILIETTTENVEATDPMVAYTRESPLIEDIIPSRYDESLLGYTPLKNRSKILKMLGMDFDYIREQDFSGLKSYYIHFDVATNDDLTIAAGQSGEVWNLLNTTISSKPSTINIGVAYEATIVNSSYRSGLYSTTTYPNAIDLADVLSKKALETKVVSDETTSVDPLLIVYILYLMKYYPSYVDTDLTILSSTTRSVNTRWTTVEVWNTLSFYISCDTSSLTMPAINSSEFNAFLGYIENKLEDVNRLKDLWGAYGVGYSQWMYESLKSILTRVNVSLNDMTQWVGAELLTSSYSNSILVDFHNTTIDSKENYFLKKSYIESLDRDEFKNFMKAAITSGYVKKSAKTADRWKVFAAITVVMVIAVFAGPAAGPAMTAVTGLTAGAAALTGISVILLVGGVLFSLYASYESRKGNTALAKMWGTGGAFLTTGSSAFGVGASITNGIREMLLRVTIMKALDYVGDKIGGGLGTVVSTVGNIVLTTGPTFGSASALAKSVMAFGAISDIYMSWTKGEYNEKMSKLQKELESEEKAAQDIIDARTDVELHLSNDGARVVADAFYNYEFLRYDADWYVKTRVENYVQNELSKYYTTPALPTKI